MLVTTATVASRPEEMLVAVAEVLGIWLVLVAAVEVVVDIWLEVVVAVPAAVDAVAPLRLRFYPLRREPPSRQLNPTWTDHSHTISATTPMLARCWATVVPLARWIGFSESGRVHRRVRKRVSSPGRSRMCSRGCSRRARGKTW